MGTVIEGGFPSENALRGSPTASVLEHSGHSATWYKRVYWLLLLLSILVILISMGVFAYMFVLIATRPSQETLNFLVQAGSTGGVLGTLVWLTHKIFMALQKERETILREGRRAEQMHTNTLLFECHPDPVRAHQAITARYFAPDGQWNLEPSEDPQLPLPLVVLDEGR